MLILRDFIPDDIGSVDKLVMEGLHERYDPTLYFNIHTYWPKGFIIAETVKNIVGFIAGVRSGPQQARILMLAVDEKKRRQGIGTKLLKAFIKRCIIEGFKSITLEVRTSNEAAIGFYARFGFNIINKLPAFYTDGEDGLQMWKKL
jgi:ribosomal-protein-alanine N-acetyltransferase